MSEGAPKKLSPKVSKFPTWYDEGWEDMTPGHEADKFGFFETDLKKAGIDLRTSKVLEIGSGNSALLAYMQKQGVDAVGVDVRPRGKTAGLPIVKARIERLPFQSETFDVVLAGSVFDDDVYNQDQSLMMEEIARVLKHGGAYAAFPANDNRISTTDLKKVSPEWDPHEVFKKT
jgi:ubiquinone/menaquinone biosynthesis C-methylase UbiE